MEFTKKQVQSIYDNMDIFDLWYIFDKIHQKHGKYEDLQIFKTDEFIEMLTGDDLLDFIDTAQDDDKGLNFHREFVLVEGYMDLTTFDYFNEIIDINDLQNMLEELSDDEIQELNITVK